ncbi:MAG: hypothetical protein IK137_03110 [Bacilli bacterium]|nr:hypothetical protein [Bacilli bacterium]
MKKTIKLIIFILIIASMLIYIGICLNNLGKPKYVFSRGIDFCKNKIDNYTKISNDLDLKDKFSIDGNIEFDIDSEYYKKTTNPEEKKTYNMINNLNNMTNSFKIQKNQSKNIGYIELNGSIDKEEILNAKYFINDSTKYYYVKNTVDNYINDGSCNYFENINTANTERDNIEYLYNFVINSLKDNLKEEYFTTKMENNTSIAIISIDNNNIKDILNGILKDLKNDEKSKKLLNNINKNILKTKISEKDNYLEKNESYKIYIYTTKILHKPIKYKIEHITKENIKTYIYEGNENKGNLYYSVNDKPVYNIAIEFKNDDIKSKIKNSSNEVIGEFKLEKNNYNTIINYAITENNEKLDLIYSSKYTNVKENQSYTNKNNLSFKYIVNKEIKLSGEITANIKVSNKFSILVDTSNAKLKLNMTEEEKTGIKNLYNNVKDRLER